MSFVIIIPSRNPSNLRSCIAAIRAADETAPIIIIDDTDKGELTAQDIEPSMERVVADTSPTPGALGNFQIILGVKPFCFARNVNIGIRAAYPSNVVLMNDDVLLKTREGLTLLERTANLFGHVCVSPRVKGPATPAHAMRDDLKSLVSEVNSVPFVCVFIPRRALNIIGWLDERFTPGSWEDDDWCLRAVHIGRIAVCNGCIVDHGSLPHTFRPAGKPQLYDLAANRQRFQDKWKVRE